MSPRPIAIAMLLAGVACKGRPALGDFELDPAYVGPVLPYAGSGGSVDTDGDGLSDAEEADLELDPTVADTDGDGYDDGIEVEAFTDPANDDDHPYALGWPIDACRADLDGGGYAVGDVIPQAEFPSQTGETVRMHDFCDHAVLLVSSAMWCGPCQAEAPHVQAMYEAYKDQGLMVATLLIENVAYQPPSETDLTEWATAYGIEHAVLSEASQELTNGFGVTGIPATHLLAPGGVVVIANGYVTEADIEAVLP